jgi:hypothetical protein
MDWFDLAQDRGLFWAVTNTARSLRLSYNTVDFLTPWRRVLLKKLCFILLLILSTLTSFLFAPLFDEPHYIWF